MDNTEQTFNPEELKVSWNNEETNTLISPIRRHYHSESEDEEEDVKPPTIENVNNSNMQQ